MAESSGRVLDEDDHGEVAKALKFVQARWREIGSQLHLKSGTLNNFDGLNPATATGKMIEAYLSGNYNTERFGLPTWKKIIEAVETPAGGQNAAEARKIADIYAKDEKFKSSYSSSHTVSDESSKVPHFPMPEVQPYDQTQMKHFLHLEGSKVVADCPNSEKIIFERFDPWPKGDRLKEVAMSFGVVKPIGNEEKKTSINEAYNMSKWPHGVCVIINNEEFTEHEIRTGTNLDERNMVQTFRHLGYIVEVHRDCSSSKIFDILLDIKERDHSKYDSFICCIMSHGKAGYIYGSDSKHVSLELITNRFQASTCKDLASKPKLFFFQACRGDNKSRGVEVVQAASAPEDATKHVVSDSDSEIIPDVGDFFFGYATPVNYKAWRNAIKGSWYVSELCKTLTSYGTFSNLESMMKWTNKKVGEKYSYDGIKQQPVYTSRLNKDVFFF